MSFVTVHDLCIKVERSAQLIAFSNRIAQLDMDGFFIIAIIIAFMGDLDGHNDESKHLLDRVGIFLHWNI